VGTQGQQLASSLLLQFDVAEVWPRQILKKENENFFLTYFFILRLKFYFIFIFIF